MNYSKTTAIVLAGGSGKRMGADCKKQYLSLCGKPLLFYALEAFEKSSVDEIILVTNEEEYCRKQIIEPGHIDKVTKIAAGGRERYDSVYQGLCCMTDSDYVLVHDGARPFITSGMIDQMIRAVQEEQACIFGVPAKDTVKIADPDGYVAATPDRSLVWNIQTPQAFSAKILLEAYRRQRVEQPAGITDDAMLIEYYHLAKIRLLTGSYENIKITTPEDLILAEQIMQNR